MTIYSEFSHEKWWFSIATLNYQRVNIIGEMYLELIGYNIHIYIYTNNVLYTYYS